jgi:hypothetical protein
LVDFAASCPRRVSITKLAIAQSPFADTILLGDPPSLTQINYGSGNRAATMTPRF